MSSAKKREHKVDSKIDQKKAKIAQSSSQNTVVTLEVAVKLESNPEVPVTEDCLNLAQLQQLKREEEEEEFAQNLGEEVEYSAMSREQQKVLVPALEVTSSPGGSGHVNKDEVTRLLRKLLRPHLKKPPTTPEVLDSPPTTSSAPRDAVLACRSPSSSEAASDYPATDSGSDDESFDIGDDEEDLFIGFNPEARQIARYLIDEWVMSEEMNEGERPSTSQAHEGFVTIGADECGEHGERMVVIEDDEEFEALTLAQAYEGLNVFTWSDDFTSFSGQEETYLRTPGPTVGSQDPIDIFTQIWDKPIMEKIVKETNKYAWHTIATLAEVENGIPNYLMEWEDTTVEELYCYFAVVMLMTLCYRSRVADYWATGSLGMSEFREVMSKNRYLLLTKFIHFVDNDEMYHGMSSYDKKIFKIRPVLDHLNKKFAELYVPNKHLSLDESLLSWKGRLSWEQSIQTESARFGIKSYELCEAVTGYQLRCLIYAGKDSKMSENPIHGLDSCTSKVVLELMDGFLDVGHTLVINNWYNKLPLARFLKRRRTDVIGTMNPRSVHVPHDIKWAKERQMARGDQVSRHCGDISLTAWMDVELVTILSTFHDDKQIPARRAGEDVSKTKAIVHYNKYMSGVDSKDQKLSKYVMERKMRKKYIWYKTVFRRLLNTSILNAFIIFSKNPVTKKVSHSDFRESLAVSLIKKHSVSEAPAPKTPAPAANVLSKDQRRFFKGARHFPEYTEKKENNRFKQLRCVRCLAQRRRSMTTVKCTFCGVALCLGSCFVEYHTLENLR